MKKSKYFVIPFIILSFIFLLNTRRGFADVKPGDVIGPNNWEKVKDLFLPWMLGQIKKGWTIKIRKTEPILPTFSKGYLEATRKYAGQAKIGLNDGLLNYKGGLPFPKIDPDDPQAGIKIMYNFYWRWTGDDKVLAVDKTGKRIVPWRRWVIDRHGNEITADTYGYFLKASARTDIPPISAFKGKEHIESYSMWINVWPRDSSGTVVFYYRYYDPKKWDDQWIFIPSIRRVRRWPTSQRCSTKAPTDYIWDDNWGWDSKVSLFKYKLLGEKKMLTIFHGKHIPYKKKKGSPWLLDEEFEVRDCYVVEITAKDPNYCYRRQVYYVDKESFHGVAKEVYDRKNEYWKEMLMFGTNYEYPDGRKFWGILGSIFVNVQTEHININCPSESGATIYYNIGLTPKFFTLSQMQQFQRGMGYVKIK
jgi:hypothetical protein